MHYREILNAEAISKFSDVREECSQSLQQRKRWIDSVHAFFNLCLKIKKVLNQIWKSSW